LFLKRACIYPPRFCHLQVKNDLLTIQSLPYCSLQGKFLAPKGQSPFFGPFLGFVQAIVDVIVVQKISNFRWTCGLVLASRRTNFYKIPIFGYTVMFQKHIFFVMRASLGKKKTFYFLTFLGWIFFHKVLKHIVNLKKF
jgi:hypothetical protein